MNPMISCQPTGGSGCFMDGSNDKWRDEFLKKNKHKCQNCGSTESLVVYRLVSIKNGGYPNDSNGTVLCRKCELSKIESTHTPKNKAVCFWVPASLFKDVRDVVDGDDGPKSFSGVVASMVKEYLKDPSAYEDLYLYSNNARDVKVSVRMEGPLYEKFNKALSFNSELQGHGGATVTDSLCGLLYLFLKYR